MLKSPFRIFTIAIIILLVLPTLIKDGMFMDGLFYASVSRNLAEGIGDFWFLSFSETYLNNYSEQLPLFFGVQSIFFKILGSSIYTERIFSLVMMALTALNINTLWKIIHEESNYIKYGWLPVLFWIITPLCFWTYTNALEETLMSVLATSAVIFILKALIQKKMVIINIALGGLFIFLCSFCKGFQGLFPLITIGLFWLCTRQLSFNKSLLLSLSLLIAPLGIYGLLLLYEPSNESIVNFYNNRIIRTFNNPNSATTQNRLYLLVKLLMDLSPAMLLTGLLYLVAKNKNKTSKIHWNKVSLFLLIGLAGSLPLLITREQRAFYLTTSIPFFAIAIALIAVPYMHTFHNNLSKKTLSLIKIGSISLLLTGLTFTGVSFGKSKRDHNKLHDVYSLQSKIPPGTIISISPSLHQDWSTYGYLSRYNKISLDQNNLRDYHLMERLDKKTPKGYEVFTTGKAYTLYVKIEE